MAKTMYFHQYYTNARREMLDFVPFAAKRILEVGCGEANFCVQLMGDDREVWGVEKNSTAAAKARQKINNVIEGDINNALPSLPSNFFDCIVFNDVLEHILYPEDLLKAIIPLLSSHGVVVSSIPNFRFIANLKEILVEKNFAYKSSGILDRTHIRFFTMKSIADMYANAGYLVLQNEGINNTPSWKVKLLIAFSFNFLSDIKSFQIATVAQPKK